MATYDIDVTVTNEPPVFFVSVDLGPIHIAMARNANGDWEGTAQGVDLDLPGNIDFTARGYPNRPFSLAVTLTPADGSAAVNYKSKDKKLDNRGFVHLQDVVKRS